MQPRKQSADLQEYRQKDTRTSAKTYLCIIQKRTNSVNAKIVFFLMLFVFILVIWFLVDQVLV